jgi:hypothetical protein
MFQRMIDDFKDSTSNALRMTYLATAAAVALFVATSFLCAAAFVAVLQAYGLITACLAGAGVFLVAAAIAGASYMAQKRRPKVRTAEPPKSAMHAALADPMLLTAGIQIIRTIGIKRLIPILAIGGVALGVLAASRRDATGEQTPAE